MSRRSRPHYHSGLEWILGVAFEDTLTRPARLAQGFTHVRCCGSPRASSPHGLAAPALASRDGRDCVQLPPARGCYHLAPRRTFTSNPAPMPGTRRVGAKDYSSAPLTEPDVRASHPALWIDISEVQRELNRNLRRVKVVPQGFERGHPSGEPCRRIGSRHCPNVGLHPCSLASSSRLVSAAPASGPIVFLRFAFCNRKFRGADASERSAFPSPEGLSASTKLNCRGPVFLNPSPPWLRWLSPASSLL